MTVTTRGRPVGNHCPLSELAVRLLLDYCWTVRLCRTPARRNYCRTVADRGSQDEPCRTNAARGYALGHDDALQHRVSNERDAAQVRAATKKMA